MLKLESISSRSIEHHWPLWLYVVFSTEMMDCPGIPVVGQVYPDVVIGRGADAKTVSASQVSMRNMASSRT
jgi:hypothetical protein